MPTRLWLLFPCLLLMACTRPVIKKASEHGLVDLKRVIPGLVVDLRYASADNITNRPLYPPRMPCLLRASTAEKLKKVQMRLRAQGFQLKIWDAWRPLEAHQALHEAGAKTGLFLNPVRGWSRHCGGIAVDVTLVDFSGKELPMPTGFDENRPETASHTMPQDTAMRQRLAALQEAMTAVGFRALPGEWWHFDDLEFLYNPVRALTAKDLGLKLPVATR